MNNTICKLRLLITMALLVSSTRTALAADSAGTGGGLRGRQASTPQQQQQQQQRHEQQPQSLESPTRELVDDSVAQSYLDSLATTPSSSSSNKYYSSYSSSKKPAAEITIPAQELDFPQTVIFDPDAGNLSHLRSGTVIAFTVEIPLAGLYRLEARVCNPNAVGSVWVYDPATSRVLSQLDYLPHTKGWNDWATSRLGLFEFNHQASSSITLHLLVQQGGWNLRHISLTHVRSAMAAYLLPTPPTNAHVYAASSYDAPSSTSHLVVEAPMGGPPSVGGIRDGAVLNYDWEDPSLLLASTSTSYRLSIAVSSPMSKAGHLAVIDRRTQRIVAELDAVPNTGGWYSFEMVALEGDIPIPAGQTGVSLQLIAFTGDFNLLLLTLEPIVSEDPTNNAAHDYKKDGLTVAGLQDHHNEEASSKVFFWATDATELHGVEVHGSSDGGPGNLGSLDQDDYFTYPLDLPSRHHADHSYSPDKEEEDETVATYQVSLRVASGWIRGAIPFIEKGGSIDFYNHDTGKWYGAIEDIPSSESWSRYITVTGEVKLPSGPFTLELRVRQGGWNLLWFQIEG